MYCKNCGKILSSDAKFCSECGTRVVVEKEVKRDSEPMFFTKELAEASAPVAEKPKKRVVHLEEFNWDLEGYPTAPKKTEDVDFNWTSVLEEKARNAAPRIPEKKAEEPEVQEEPEITVDDLVDALPDESEAEVMEAIAQEAVEPEAESAEDGEKTLEEEIFENISEAPLDEPTKLIDKAQMKTGGVDRFYTFSKKQEEFQAMLDEEFERLQNGESDEAEDFEVEQPLMPEFVTEEVVEPEVSEAVKPEEEPSVAEADEIAEPVETVEPETVEEVPLELVAVVWASAPYGYVVCDEADVAETVEAETVEAQEDAEAGEEAVEEAQAEASVEDMTEETEAAEEVKETSPSKGEEEPESRLTFDDVFRDDEDDEEEKEKGGCLKALAILLCILVVIELGILGVQYFAPDSQVGKYIDQGYRYVVNLISGHEEETEEPEETSGPTEVQQIISAQMGKNENIVAVSENTELLFEEGNDYGYEEFANTYGFQNSPWYDNDEGHSVSFGDEIIGTLIQYYSAYPDKVNDVNNDVVDFIDDTTKLYEETEAIEGKEDRNYVIQNLEIGEIRTGGSGFYVLTRTTVTDSENKDGVVEEQVVYLEPNTTKKEMKIIEMQKN